MASITIRNLSDTTKDILRVRAAEQGMSLEAYVRTLLQKESTKAPTRLQSIADCARESFGPKHGLDLDLPPRSSHRPTPDLDT